MTSRDVLPFMFVSSGVSAALGLGLGYYYGSSGAPLGYPLFFAFIALMGAISMAIYAHGTDKRSE